MTSETSVFEMLKNADFFRGIAEHHLRRLLPLARPMEFPARHTIFREHDKAVDVFVIISGRVSLLICQPKVGCRQLTEVGPGELIGWSPLVGRSYLSDTAMTMVPTKVVAMDGEKILAQCQANPDFGYEFMQRAAQVLSDRLTATRLQLFELGGHHLPDVQIESD